MTSGGASTTAVSRFAIIGWLLAMLPILAMKYENYMSGAGDCGKYTALRPQSFLLYGDFAKIVSCV